MNSLSADGPTTPRGKRALEVFWVFLLLGCTSFGGPIAHLGFFREAFVLRRRWMSESQYADVVALCQFLPGPASSQVGMAVGLHRAGIAGLLAAFAGFTAPSAVLLVGLGFGIAVAPDLADAGWVAGVKAAAVAVVAHAVWGMARSLAPDAKRAAIASAALVALAVIPGTVTQITVLVLGALAGSLWLAGLVRPRGTASEPDDAPGLDVQVPRAVSVCSLVVFALLLVGLPVLNALTSVQGVSLMDIFYRAGALVFGGGHVVLPLLEADLVQPGLVDAEVFMAGYGAAQAVPGPLFTLAGYLGVLNGAGPAGMGGAVLALGAIFLPSVLLVLGVLPYWVFLRQYPLVQRAAAGVNAAVVGVLAAAFVDPVLTQGVTEPVTFFLAVVGFTALSVFRVPAWAVVGAAAVVGAVVW